MAYPAYLREMISRYDWAAAPLGPLPDWPASGVTATGGGDAAIWLDR